MKRVLTAGVALAFLSLASGCGLKGSLDRPAPMWGSERATYKEQQRKAEADAAAAKQAQRPHVDIPVDGATTTAETTTPPSTSGISTADTTGADTDTTKKPDVKNSGGAVPPVLDNTGSRSRY